MLKIFSMFFKTKRKNTTVNIFVGNLSYSATEKDLRAAFEKFGPINSIRIARDRFGKPKGFGFVEMGSNEAGNEAMHKLNGYVIGGRPIRVTEAKARVEKEIKKKW